MKFVMFGFIGLLLISCDSPNKAAEKQVSQFNDLKDEINATAPTINAYAQAIAGGQQFTAYELNEMQATTEAFISKLKKFIHIQENPKSGVIIIGDIQQARQSQLVAEAILGAIKTLSGSKDMSQESA